MRRTDIHAQFAWYLMVGGLSFGVDIGAFLALQALATPVLAASALAFAAATAANYVLSYVLAFERGRFSRGGEIRRLLIVALVGLALNTGLVWLFVTATPMPPVMAKILAVPLVLAWNFLGRRWFVFRPEMPVRTYAATEHLVHEIEARWQGEPDRRDD